MCKPKSSCQRNLCHRRSISYSTKYCHTLVHSFQQWDMGLAAESRSGHPLVVNGDVLFDCLNEDIHQTICNLSAIKGAPKAIVACRLKIWLGSYDNRCPSPAVLKPLANISSGYDQGNLHNLRFTKIINKKNKSVSSQATRAPKCKIQVEVSHKRHYGTLGR